MIRKVKPTDATRIFELEKQLFKDFYSLEIINADIKNKNNIYYLFEENGMVVGYCLISYLFEEGNLAKIGVAKEYQNKGIATKLYFKCEQEAKNKGVEKIYLEVSDRNEKAISLYKKLGYTKEWVRSRYYSDLTDAIIFEKKL